MEYYSEIRKKELLKHTKMYMTLQSVWLSKRNHRQNTACLQWTECVSPKFIC